MLMFGDSGALAINPALTPGLGYDPIKDFTPVTALVTLPTILVTHPDVQAKTLGEFIALAKKQPGQMSFGSAGAGSIHQLTFAIFAEQTGIDLLHVPYRGGTALVAGLVKGEVQVGWSGIPNVLPLIEDGKLRVLCISTQQRSKSVADVPTAIELGVEGFDYATMHRQHTNDDGCASLSTHDDRVARQHIRVGRGAKAIRQPFKAGLRFYIGDEQSPVPDMNAVVKDAVRGCTPSRAHQGLRLPCAPGYFFSL